MLERTGLSIDDIGLFELNEPFAVQVLSWCDGMGVSPEDERLNPYGGAIACGHPLAATGVRLMAQLAYGMHERDVRYGLTALCVGMGMGAALVWENRVPDTTFFLNRVETEAGPLALVTMDNGEDWTKPTVLNRSAFESADRVIGELESGDWVAMVLTGKPFVFCAGADIDEFPKISSREEAIEGSRAGHDLFGRIRALPFPTVAAINGACLGGGVEIALHCDARTIASSVRHFALPECFLGIIPGWGGTQLVPRLVDPKTAVRFVVQNPLRQNRMLSGPEALEYGLADRVLEPVEFLDESIAFALELVRTPLERQPPDTGEMEETIRRARSQLDDTVHGAAIAPYRALDLIEGTAGWTVEEGYREEEEAVADLILSRQAQASLYAFDLVERRAKRKVGVPDAEPRMIRKVGIVGAGLMARQLAALFVRRLELPLVIRDLDQDVVDSAIADIGEELDDAAARGRHDRGQGALPALDRHRHDLVRGLRGLRLRARGGVRGDGREEAGLRRARAGRLAGMHPRDQHVIALDHGDGRRPRASRAARRTALLQPRQGAAARRADPDGRDRRRHRRDDLQGRDRPAQAPGARPRTHPASSSIASSPA